MIGDDQPDPTRAPGALAGAASTSNAANVPPRRPGNVDGGRPDHRTDPTTDQTGAQPPRPVHPTAATHAASAGAAVARSASRRRSSTAASSSRTSTPGSPTCTRRPTTPSWRSGRRSASTSEAFPADTNALSLHRLVCQSAQATNLTSSSAGPNGSAPSRPGSAEVPSTGHLGRISTLRRGDCVRSLHATRRP